MLVLTRAVHPDRTTDRCVTLGDDVILELVATNFRTAAFLLRTPQGTSERWLSLGASFTFVVKGATVVVALVRLERNKARLGITAPRHVSIGRDEHLSASEWAQFQERARTQGRAARPGKSV